MATTESEDGAGGAQKAERAPTNGVSRAQLKQGEVLPPETPQTDEELEGELNLKALQVLLSAPAVLKAVEAFAAKTTIEANGQLENAKNQHDLQKLQTEKGHEARLEGLKVVSRMYYVTIGAGAVVFLAIAVLVDLHVLGLDTVKNLGFLAVAVLAMLLARLRLFPPDKA